MNPTYILIALNAALLTALCALIVLLRRDRRELRRACAALDDILSGQYDRRILARGGSITADICYKINEIAMQCREDGVQSERAAAMQKQLMTSFSHDIRTPLTTLIGYLDAVQAHVVSAEEREQYISTAMRKAKELGSYTNSVFELFKLYSRDMAFNIVRADICELTRNIAQDWIPQFERYGIAYDIQIGDGELYIETDIGAYTRIANNLIQNALQHSEGTQIAVILEESEDCISLTIEDNGKGIPPDKLPYIFERLYKCDESRGSAGSGIGLSIVTELARGLGGSCEVTSEPWVKTSFVLSLRK